MCGLASGVSCLSVFEFRNTFIVKVSAAVKNIPESLYDCIVLVSKHACDSCLVTFMAPVPALYGPPKSSVLK